MRRMLVGLIGMCLAVWGAALVLVARPLFTADIVIPTLMVLPSLTPTPTASNTLIPSLTPTAFPTETVTPTSTFTPTATSTLSERVIELYAVMPGVDDSMLSASGAIDTTSLLVPPPIEPLPDATLTAPPFNGWIRFESDFPTVHYQPMWIPRLADNASEGQYHRTEQAGALAAFAFEGEALRVRYVAASNMGQFDVVVDGVVLETIDAYAETLMFPMTQTYPLTRGAHLLNIRTTGQKNARSSGIVVGLDAIHVFRADPDASILTPTFAPDMPTSRPVQVELVSAPPTLQPTGTSVPPRTLQTAVVIAYDENGNRAIDPAEGVAGISVRIVEETTNRIIASAFTDVRGYVAFELVTDAPLRVVVPYFGESWTVRDNGDAVHTLLLPPGNQPGLIP